MDEKDLTMYRAQVEELEELYFLRHVAPRQYLLYLMVKCYLVLWNPVLLSIRYAKALRLGILLGSYPARTSFQVLVGSRPI